MGNWLARAWTGSLGPKDAARLGALGAIWGASALSIKVIVDHVPPLWLVVGRVWSGLLVVLVIMGVRRRRLPRSGRVWCHLVVLGTIGTAVPWVIAAWAQASLTASLGSMLAAPTPATTLALAAAVGVERATRQRVLGLLVALVGTLAIVGSGVGDGAPAVPVVAAAATTILFAFGTVYAKRYLAGVPGVTIAAGQLAASAVLVLPVALIAGEAPPWGAVPAVAWALWIALGAVSTGLAYAVFYGLVERIGPSTAQTVTYIIPPIGAVMAWLVLHETIGMEVVFGTAIILAGLWIAQRPPPRMASVGSIGGPPALPAGVPSGSFAPVLAATGVPVGVSTRRGDEDACVEHPFG